MVYIWTTLYHEFEREVYHQHINAEKYFDAEIADPDYDTDAYFVPKHRKYCLANFLYFVMNKKEKLSERKLFFDYAPNNALKLELGKKFTMSSSRIFNTYISKKTIEKRKNMHLDPKISLLFTKPSLYYSMVIGKHYKCAFQASNHVPGEGKLSRPDLLANLVKDHLEGENSIQVDLGFYPHTYRLYVKEECEAYFHLINDPSFRDLLKSQIYFIRKEVQEKKVTKLSYFEDHNLNHEYRRGQMCGKKVGKSRDIIQKYISDQILFEGKYKFTLRAYMFVASFDPLVAYYHEGSVRLEIEDSIYPDSMRTYSQLEADLKKRGMISNETQFTSKIIDQIKHILRSTILLSKDHFLKDPKSFHLFAFDLVLDNSLKLWLIDIKNAPYMQLHHKPMLEEILDFVFQLNEARNSKQWNHLRKLYAETVEGVREGSLNIENHKEFVSGLRNYFVMRREREAFRTAARSFPDYLKLSSNFEILYDGRIGHDHLSSPALELERFKLKLKYNKVDKL